MAGFNFSNEKRQKMAICSPVYSPVRPCSPVLDCLNSDMSRPNQRPPAGQPVQGRSTPSLPRPWLGAAVCFGPSLNPLGRFAQQSEMAARITRTATIQGEPAKGGVPCPRSASGTRPTCRTVRPRGDNRHSSRPQGCNLRHIPHGHHLRQKLLFLRYRHFLPGTPGTK